MKQAAARVLSTLDLDSIILLVQANEGRTIIEKFEKHAEVGFAVVLLSGDDMAYPGRP
jgi:predicted nucleotide-binding protein